MFGLGEKKEPSAGEFCFEMEKELLDPERASQLASKVAERVRAIKSSIRNGAEKELFAKFGILLNGYHALAVVLSRVTQGPDKKRRT